MTRIDYTDLVGVSVGDLVGVDEKTPSGINSIIAKTGKKLCFMMF